MSSLDELFARGKSIKQSIKDYNPDSVESLQEEKEAADQRVSIARQKASNLLPGAAGREQAQSLAADLELSERLQRTINEQLEENRAKASQQAAVKRVSGLKSAGELKEAAAAGEDAAVKAGARAQAMLANPMAADWEEYFRLKAAEDSGRQQAAQAESDLALRRQLDANEEAVRNIASLIRQADRPAGSALPPPYTAADKQEVDFVLRLLDDPSRANAFQLPTDVWNASRLSHLTKDEENALRSYARQGNYGRAAELLDSLDRVLNQRQTQANSATIQREAKESPLLGAAASTIFSLGQPLAYAGGLVQGAKNLFSGEDEAIDPNSYLMSMANAAQFATQGTVEGVNEAVGRDVSFLTETGLSILQNLSRLPLGAAALPYMAASAAGSSTLEGAQRGLSVSDTLALATITGLVEAATEKVPLDNLLKNLSGGVDSVADAILKQVATEGAEEGIAQYTNLAADLIVRGSNADMFETMRELQDMGYSQKDAFLQALVQYAVKAPALSAAGGAISGGILGGGTALAGTLSNRTRTAQNESGPAPRATTPAQAETALKRSVLRKMTLEDFSNADSPVWNNVAYEDADTQAEIMSNTHQEMVAAGEVVSVPDDTVSLVSESYPDLRTIKKAERKPILAQKMQELKTSLRQFLNGLKSEKFELEVNGNLIEARLYDTGVREVMEKITQEKASMLYHSDQIFKNARYMYSTPDYGGDSNVYRWNYFYAPVQIGNEIAGVRIAVKDVARGTNFEPESQIYNWGIKKGATLSGGSRGPKVASPSASSVAPISNNMLPQAENIVKSEQENNGLMPGAIGPESSVGAAISGFAGAYDALQGASSRFHPEGENAVRFVDMPTTNLQGQAIPKSAQTVLESSLLDDENAKMVLEEIAGGAFGANVLTDAKAVSRATRTIEKNGWDSALNTFLSNAERRRVDKYNVALGAILLNNAAQKHDARATMDILAAYTKTSRSAAQALQAQRILKKLTPEGRLYGIQRTVDGLQDELFKRYGDKAPDLTIDTALAQAFLDAENDEQRDQALDRIYQNVAAQVPATWQDKWNAWRYLAMLGNLRTHVRNILGNAGMQGLRIVKDRAAAGLETAVDAVSRARGGAGIERSKSFLASPALYGAAWDDYENIPEEAKTGSKYASSDLGKIDERRTIFKLKPLEALRRKSGDLLSAEDNAFKRFTYADALAGYLARRGVTARQLQGGAVRDELMESARAYAMDEALKATYQDSNAFSDYVSSLGNGWKNSNNPVARAASAVVEGVLPFKRTPANILVRGAEYSPLGFVKALYQAADRQEAAKVIDTLASSLTGSGFMLAGYLLASTGLLTVPEPDEEQAAFNDLIGQQDYALQLSDGTSVTMDWLAPAVLPVFVGATLTELGGEEGYNPRQLMEALSRIADPMLEMSMLQSLSDILESGLYSDSPTASIIWSVVTSYLTQGIPTILGQAKRTAQSESMTTYTTTGNGALPGLDRFLGKASARLPVPGYAQIPYINAWGERESTGSLPYRAFNNFLNPAYISNRQMDATEKELQRLYDAGQTNVFPERAEKSFQVDGETVYLTKEQYVTYAETKGRTAKAALDELLQSGFYQSADSSEKAALISDVYSYATAYAKTQVSGYTTDNKLVAAAAQGIDVVDYLEYSSGKEKNTMYETAAALLETDMTTEQMGTVWQSANKEWKQEKNPFTGTLPQYGLTPKQAVGVMEQYSNSRKKADMKAYCARQGFSARQTSAILDLYF